MGKAALKRLRQEDFLRQMLRIEWIEIVKFLDHWRGDPLRLAILRAAMHYAMSHGSQCITTFFNPIHENAHCDRVIRRRYGP